MDYESKVKKHASREVLNLLIKNIYKEKSVKTKSKSKIS